jgi:hypothetical protein
MKEKPLDLVLDWKPLYSILESNYFTKVRRNIYTPKEF